MKKDIWRGWIIYESLKDIQILSKVKIISSKIEDNTEGDKKEVWKLYTVEIKDKDISKMSKIFEDIIKPEYYVHFTNGNELLIIFSGKSFRVKLKKVGKEEKYGITSFNINPESKKIWKSALEYGVKKGRVDSRYIVKVE